MLCDEGGMIVPGCLLPVVGREDRCQSFFEEFRGMQEDLAHSIISEISKLLLVQVDPVAKRGFAEAG